MLAKPNKTENKIVVDFFDENGEYMYTQDINPETGEYFVSIEEAQVYCDTINQDAIQDLELIKQKKCELVNKHKKDVIENHFVITFNEEEYPIDFDLESQVNLAGIFTKALSDPNFSTNFITKDNRIIKLTHDDILFLGQQAQEWKSDVVIEAAKLKQQIREAKTFDEIKAIKIELAGIPFEGDDI